MRPKKILLTGTRLLCSVDLARQLNSAGHDVYAADTSPWHLIRFSNAIKEFFTVPSPRYQTKDFIDSIAKLIEQKKIDLVIPIWEETLFLSQARERFPSSCEIFCSSFELIHELHNKWLFIKKQKSLGIKTPSTILIRSPDDLRLQTFPKPYILKACYSRGSHRVINEKRRKSPPLKITPGNPWIVQEFIEGKHYCSYSVCYEGKIQAHAFYPVQHTLEGSSCLVFKAITHSKAFKWVENFIRKISYTGQIGLDFIETPSGELYVIDGNPRATSGLHLFTHEDHLDQAFLRTTPKAIFPKDGNSKQIAAGMLLYGWRTAFTEHKMRDYLKTVFTTKDVIFDSKDLKPFLSEPCILSSYLFKSKKKGKPIPVWFTYDLEWDREPEKIGEKLSLV